MLTGHTISAIRRDGFRLAADHASTLSDVPRDPEARGFVRLEQQYRNTPKEPSTSGARTRQDSLKLTFWGSRGTTETRSNPNYPAHLVSTGTRGAWKNTKGLSQYHAAFIADRKVRTPPPAAFTSFSSIKENTP